MAVTNDPLARMPGTQPGQVVDLESDKQCLSCHGGSTYTLSYTTHLTVESWSTLPPAQQGAG